MTEHNHHRGTKSTKDHKAWKHTYMIGGSKNISILSDRVISAGACIADTEAYSTTSRTRKNLAGAKKYVRSRTRFHENAALKRLVKDETYD